MNLRWLQWSRLDLQQGLGGVEVHARSLDRELKKLGIDAHISNDSRAFEQEWDVIQAHGSAPLPLLARITRKDATPPILVHTLHGTTIGRMAACREWTWPGGYFAAVRELWSVLRADVVVAIHPDLWLFKFAQWLGKTTAVCWNGFDAATAEEPLPDRVSAAISNQSFWLFIGRGHDRVKGAHRLRALIESSPGLRLVAVPGDGFENLKDVVKTGVLSSNQVRTLLELSRGLIIPSLYEGLPLVALEALGAGIPVVSSRVGGLPFLPPALTGLKFADFGVAGAAAQALREAEDEYRAEGRAARAKQNRAHVPTWAGTAKTVIAAVEDTIKRRTK